jgi:hypothetical protein
MLLHYLFSFSAAVSGIGQVQNVIFNGSSATAGFDTFNQGSTVYVSDTVFLNFIAIFSDVSAIVMVVPFHSRF